MHGRITVYSYINNMTQVWECLAGKNRPAEEPLPTGPLHAS